VRVLKRLAPAAAVLLATSLTACSDSASPDDVNAGTIEAGFSVVTATFNNNAAFQSMAVLSNAFPAYAASAALRASLPQLPPSSGSAVLAQAGQRLRTVRALASLRSNPQALFPANVLGKTLVWDTTAHAFVISALTGAPAAGIRILIYAVNPVTEQPIVPLQELGYVDLTDESSPAADQLGVFLTLGATTIADYTVSLVSGTTQTTVGAKGYINNTDGAGRVDFDFNNNLDFQAQTLSITSQLTSGNASIFVDVEEDTASVILTIRVEKAGNAIEMHVVVDDSNGAITGTVKYNGVTVATISGSVNGPVFTSTAGRVLTAADTAALIGIFEKALDVATDLGDAVFRPAAVVFN